MITLVLALLAVGYAGPLPALLGRARLRRSPTAAMLLWQSVALAAVLAALGAGLSLATDHAWRAGMPLGALVIAAVAVGLTALVLGRLLLSGHRVGTELRSLRRRHRRQLDLVARRTDATEPGDAYGRSLRVLDHDIPVAYCLPGMGSPRVVVSVGTLGRLRPEEIAAVLAHERAHLRARHDLVLEAFSVLHRAFPRWVSSRAALAEVRLLVEVLADRAAVRRGGGDPRPLARALVALADGRTPGAALGAGGAGNGGELAARVDLLSDRRQHWVQAVLLAAAAVLVLLVPTVFVVLPWLTSLG